MSNTTKPKGATPLYVLGVIAGLVAGALVAYFASDIGLPKHQGLPALAGIAIAAAAVILAFVWVLASLAGKAAGMKVDGGLLGVAMAFPAAGVILLILIVQTQLYKSQQRQIDAITATLYGQLLPDIQKYHADLEALHVNGMTSAQHLFHGVNAPQMLATLKSAHEAGAREQDAFAAKADKARGEISAAQIPARHKAAALGDFDHEFSQSGGTVKKLTGFQDERLSIMEDEIKFLAGKSWSAATAFMVFAKDADTQAWRSKDTARSQAEGQILELEDQFRTNSRGKKED